MRWRWHKPQRYGTVPAAARGGSARTGGRRGAAAASPPDRRTRPPCRCRPCAAQRGAARGGAARGGAVRGAAVRGAAPNAGCGAKASAFLGEGDSVNRRARPPREATALVAAARLELLLHNLALLVHLCTELVHCLRCLSRHNRSAQRATWRATATARAAVEFAQRAWFASASSMASSEVASTRFASSAKCSGYRAICCTTDAVVSHRLLRTKAAGRGAHVRMTRDA